jgi:predicted nucleic acid-binding protein
MTESKLKIYLETTVWSFALADDAPDYRADTEDFLERCRQGDFLPFISSLVIEEIRQADALLSKALENLVAEIRPTLFPMSDRALRLADAFLAAGVVPPSKPADAGHVAAAFEMGLDALVSWNFRHIANIRRAERFNAVAVLQGYHHQLRIVSPGEVLYAQDDS